LQSVCNAIDRTESPTNCETFGHADLRPNGDPECGANCRAELHTNDDSVCQAHNPANRQTYEIADENPAQYTLPALDTFKSIETDCFEALTSVTVSRGYKICVV
jgi:hypothetical protein